MKETNLQPKENTMNKPTIHLTPRSFFIMLLVFSACLFSGCGDTPLPENHFGTQENDNSGGQAPNEQPNQEDTSSGSSTGSGNDLQSAEPHFVLGEGWKRHPTRWEEAQLKLDNGDYLRLSIHEPEIEAGQTLEEYSDQYYKIYYQIPCSGLTPEQLEATKENLPPACFYGHSKETLTVNNQPVYLIKAYDGLFQKDFSLFIFEKEGKIHEIIVTGPIDNHLEDFKQMISSFSYAADASDTPKTTEEEWSYPAGSL